MGKKTALYFYAAAFLLFCISSCAVKNPNEKQLLLYARAKTLYAEGRFDETSAVLSKKNSGFTAQFFIPILILRGKAEYFQGRLDDAEKTFRRALRLRPFHTEASIFLAGILRETGRNNEAKTMIETVLSGDPSNIRALRLAAGLNGDMERNGAAMAFLDRAAALGEEMAMVFLDRARLFWVSGRYGEALFELRRAKILSPADGGLMRAIENLENTILENI
jgi:tetratricopeptide (TPR) repeat protein